MIGGGDQRHINLDRLVAVYLLQFARLQHTQQLTEQEKTVLRFAGKITKEQIEQAEMHDIAPPWRLACQFVLLNEDILVTF